MSAFDEIHVANLALQARIGVTEEERSRPQPIAVSLTIRPLIGFTNLDDRIENAVNYSSVCATVRALVADRSCRLIETLASEIAETILSHFPAASVQVELRKYVLPDTDYVAVHLTRHRASDFTPSEPTHEN